MSRPTFQYGGQAVIEGVMMRGPGKLAVAVRRPAGDIIVESWPVNPLAAKYPVLGWPLVRGFPALLESLIIGLNTLVFSANQAALAEEEKLSGKEVAITVLLAVVVAVVLFIIIPTTAAHYLSGLTNFLKNLAEGVIRLIIFLAYIVIISRIRDIRRVFEYHGAEHKVIHAYEAGEDLVVGKVGRYSPLHPRCGTAFLLEVLVLTIIFFSFLDTPDLASRIVSRMVLLPVVTGFAYEVLKFSGRHFANPLVRALVAPGLWLQKLTTREPDEAQLEVAIRAMTAVL